MIVKFLEELNCPFGFVKAEMLLYLFELLLSHIEDLVIEVDARLLDVLGSQQPHQLFLSLHVFAYLVAVDAGRQAEVYEVLHIRPIET